MRIFDQNPDEAGITEKSKKSLAGGCLSGGGEHIRLTSSWKTADLVTKLLHHGRISRRAGCCW